MTGRKLADKVTPPTTTPPRQDVREFPPGRSSRVRIIAPGERRDDDDDDDNDHVGKRGGREAYPISFPKCQAPPTSLPPASLEQKKVGGHT